MINQSITCPNALFHGLACYAFALVGVEAAFNFVDTTSIRSLSGSQTNEWDVFSDANGSNLGDITDESGATVSQSNVGISILTSGGNIYSPTDPITIKVDDSPTYVNVGTGTFIGSVVVQFSTFGAVHDTANVIFTYTDTLANTQQLAFSGFEQATTLFDFDVPGGRTSSAADQKSAYQWDLTGLDAVSLAIEIPAEGSSMSLDQLVLDTVSTDHAFEQVVIPEPGSTFLVLVSATGLAFRRVTGSSRASLL